MYGLTCSSSLVSNLSASPMLGRFIVKSKGVREVSYYGKELDRIFEATVLLRKSSSHSHYYTQKKFKFTGKTVPFSTMADSQKLLLDKAKKLAAYQAVDEHIRDGQVVGIGSGSTVVYAVERIAQRVKEDKLKLVCIPTSFQAKNLIITNGLQLSELDVHYPIDVTIDGCDECDQDLNVIKGGGGCLLQEKIIASASKKFIIVADFTKESQYLGEKWKKGIPLEVAQLGSRVVLEKLQKFTTSVGAKNPTTIRQAVSKMGPVITDNGNFVVDFQFGDSLKTNELHTAKSIDSWLKTIPGILETGLFVRMANQAYFGQPDGTVRQTTERVFKNGM